MIMTVLTISLVCFSLENDDQIKIRMNSVGNERVKKKKKKRKEKNERENKEKDQKKRERENERDNQRPELFLPCSKQGNEKEKEGWLYATSGSLASMAPV